MPGFTAKMNPLPDDAIALHSDLELCNDWTSRALTASQLISGGFTLKSFVIGGLIVAVAILGYLYWDSRASRLRRTSRQPRERCNGSRDRFPWSCASSLANLAAYNHPET
jgi:hypothetical protein